MFTVINVRKVEDPGILLILTAIFLFLQWYLCLLFCSFMMQLFIHCVRFRWQSFGSWGGGLHFREEPRVLHAEQIQFLTDLLQDTAEPPAKLGSPLGKPIFHLIFSPVLQRKRESIQQQTRVKPTVECKQQLGGITLVSFDHFHLFRRYCCISRLSSSHCSYPCIYRNTEYSIFSK